MRSMSALLTIPAALGLVLATAGDAGANCRHGYVHCTACGGYGAVYGYGPGGMLAPQPQPLSTPMPALLPAPVGGLGWTAGLGAPPPSPDAAPGPLRAASGVMVAPTTRPTYYSPAYGYTAAPALPAGVAAPAFQQAYYGYGYGAAAAPEAARPSFLEGYNEAAAVLPVAAGTPLFNGQLFGSHIFQVLRQFGQGLDKQALFEMAVRAFINASGFAPTTAEREILERIVAQFLRGAGGGGGVFGDQDRPQDTPPVVGRPPAVAGGTVVTIEIPPGGRVEILNKGGQVVRGKQEEEQPGGDGPQEQPPATGGQDDVGAASPPTGEAAPAMPEVPKPSPVADSTDQDAPEEPKKKRAHPG